MRIVCGVLFVLMIIFMVVQFNDPDGLFWVAIYSVPAFWALIAVLRPAWSRNTPARVAVGLCAFVALAGVFYYWPSTPGWWKQEVWWETETAREGMGMMIVLFVLLVSALSIMRMRRDV